MNFRSNKEKRHNELQEECDELVYDLEEHKHFRAQVQSKKVAWNAFPKTTLTSFSSYVDNVLRNFAYYSNIRGSNALDYFFKSVGRKILKKIEKEYPQRPMYADWRAYRWYLKHNKLTKKQKQKDEDVKVSFNATYGRNSPLYDCSIWPEERIA